VLLGDLNDRIDARLTVVADEIRGISARSRPLSAESAADRVRRIFRGYLRNNLPPRDGMLLTVVDGRPYLRSRTTVPYRVDLDRRLTARWASPRDSERGSAETPAGPIEYLALPLRSRGQTRGVFVAGRVPWTRASRADVGGRRDRARRPGDLGRSCCCRGSVRSL